MGYLPGQRLNLEETAADCGKMSLRQKLMAKSKIAKAVKAIKAKRAARKAAAVEAAVEATLLDLEGYDLEALDFEE